jgi:hypothetical protein
VAAGATLKLVVVDRVDVRELVLVTVEPAPPWESCLPPPLRALVVVVVVALVAAVVAVVVVAVVAGTVGDRAADELELRAASGVVVPVVVALEPPPPHAETSAPTASAVSTSSLRCAFTALESSAHTGPACRYRSSNAAGRANGSPGSARSWIAA